MRTAYTDYHIERRARLNGPEAAKEAEAFNAAFDRGYFEQQQVTMIREKMRRRLAQLRGRG